MTPLELNMEVQEMPADGSLCIRCDEVIKEKMFQYFLFEDLEPMPTRFIYCEKCYNER